jgi:hypothetical protein
MTGLSQDDFEQVKEEILTAWNRADSRDAGFAVIVEYGRKHGYKNVIAAIQGRMPKRFTREKSVDEWVQEQAREEAAE